MCHSLVGAVPEGAAQPDVFPPASTVFRHGGRTYYVKQPPVATLASPSESSSPYPVPCVLVTLPRQCGDGAAFVRDKLRQFEESGDDVYDMVFAESANFVFQDLAAGNKDEDNEGAKTGLDDAVADVLGLKNAPRVRAVHHAPHGVSLPEGPYFRCGPFLHQAWRLYDDTLSAFVLATVPRANMGHHAPNTADKYTFDPVMATSASGSDLAVAVPSRLYTPPHSQPADKPLWGKRISIKDNIHLAGVRTSMANRAYTECYGAQPETAAYIRRLVDMGAVIVGKTKLGAFAGSEGPPNLAIDYFPSWNPRADGYQNPSGSSTGAGLCVAGYEWCDFAIGTDTTGSTRSPARVCGVHGLRMTSKILDTKGLVPSCQDFDSIGLITRSIDDMASWTRLSLDRTVESIKLPKRIVYPTDWPLYEIPEQQQMQETFLAVLERALGVKHERINMQDMWKRDPPPEAGDKSMSDFIWDVCWTMHFHDNYHNMNDFRAEYQEKFKKPVYVSPAQRWKWDLAAKVTPEQRAAAQTAHEVFVRWIGEHVLTRDADGNSEVVMLLRAHDAKPNYRDEPNPMPDTVHGLDMGHFAPLAGIPQLITPIGQIPYQSRITERTECLPAIATISGAPGSDAMLAKVMKLALEKGGYPTEVLVGRNAFPAEE